VPTVSVVVPCYKYGRYVTDCVTSLLGNTQVDLDILVIDDASPDDSWSVVQQLPGLDPRIRVRRNEQNQGLIGTANAAIAAATGDYVVLLSADDALTPGWLDRGVGYLERNPRAVLAYGPTRRFAGAMPKLHVKRRVRPVEHDGHEWIAQVCQLGVTPMLSPEVIVRTSAQHTVGGYCADLPYSSDMEMWLRLASVGDVIRVDGPIAAFYRVSAQSMSRGVYLDLLRELEVRRDAVEVWFRFAAGRVPDRTRMLATARRSLAQQAVRRASLALLHEAMDDQFDGLCAFALDNDEAWAASRIDRLRSIRSRGWARLARRALLPAAKAGVRARLTAADLRARLHLL
jgi:glycosyltransferase involved in cell wall biosynthesis